MAGMKITLLILVTIACCECAPGYRRDFAAEKEDSVIAASALHRENDEVPLDDYESTGGSTPIENETMQEIQQTDNTQLEQDAQTIAEELLENKVVISEPGLEESNEDEPQVIPVQITNPLKSQIDLGKSVLNSDSKQQIVKLGSSDPYEKLLESFIRGIMSRVLYAEIKEVRVEEMARGKRKDAAYE